MSEAASSLKKARRKSPAVNARPRLRDPMHVPLARGAETALRNSWKNSVCKRRLSPPWNGKPYPKDLPALPRGRLSVR
jgi:hypothetical protein